MPTFKHSCGYEKVYDIKCPQCGAIIDVKTSQDLIYALMAEQINQFGEIDKKVDKP